MRNKLAMKAYSIDDISIIPKNKGIYAFYMDIINPGKIGLIGNGNFDDSQLLRAKDLLLRKVSKYLSIARSDNLTGNLTDVGKSEYISRKYNINAIGTNSNVLIDYLKDISLNDIYDYSILAETLSIFAQPIYVGITNSQTLHDRYKQHKYDFEYSKDRSKFGCRVKEIELDWDELVFCCVELNNISDNSNLIKFAEKQLQSVSMPILSLR